MIFFPRRMMLPVIVVAASVVALAWWFRYRCALILGAMNSRDRTSEVAAANHLGVLEVQQHLADTHERGHLDRLQEMLRRDYRLLKYLLHHTPALESGAEVVEQRLMMLDFELLRTCYALISSISRSGARRALREMTQVVCYFANALGHRAGCAAGGD